jgi:putative ABC transport system permease protein
VVTSEAAYASGASGPGGQVPAEGLDGNTLNLADAVTASALPRVGADAVMVDLGLLQRFQVSPSIPAATDQVWLGPSAPADALARLEAAGLRVESVQRASALLSRMQRSGQALADDFLLVATVAALLVAAASTLGALGGTLRQRATEFTSLRVAGVKRGTLARCLALETGVLALTALFGAAAGVVAALLALPSLPELASAPAIPLDYGLPGALVATVSAAVIVVVILAGAGVAAGVLGRMSPSLLRTAPNDTAA